VLCNVFGVVRELLTPLTRGDGIRKSSFPGSARERAVWQALPAVNDFIDDVVQNRGRAWERNVKNRERFRMDSATRPPPAPLAKGGSDRPSLTRRACILAVSACRPMRTRFLGDVVVDRIGAAIEDRNLHPLKAGIMSRLAGLWLTPRANRLGAVPHTEA
jgi:hypothetical protein